MLYCRNWAKRNVLIITLPKPFGWILLMSMPITWGKYPSYFKLTNFSAPTEEWLSLRQEITEVKLSLALAWYQPWTKIVLIGALEDYDAALKADPNYKDAIQMRGMVRHGLGMHRAAIRDYNTLVSGNPSHVAWYTFLLPPFLLRQVGWTWSDLCFLLQILF